MHTKAYRTPLPIPNASSQIVLPTRKRVSEIVPADSRDGTISLTGLRVRSQWLEEWKGTMELAKASSLLPLENLDTVEFATSSCALSRAIEP